MKLRLFSVSFDKKEKAFIDCYRDTKADREHVVARFNVRIWSSSSLRFSFCDEFVTSGFHIVFATTCAARRVFAFERFIRVCRGLYRELAHTVISLADLSFDRFWLLMLQAFIFVDFWCVLQVDFSAFRSFWLLFYLDLISYRISDGIVFVQKLSMKLFMLRTELLLVL